MATTTASGTPKSKATVVIASLMLFSMFFGAGNLIFPPMVGVSAGTNFWPAVLGFLAAGVLLPVLAIIAVAISGRSVRDLGANGGAIFGVVFSAMAYLSIGAFYALPRTGAVSMETAITPLLGWEGTLASGLFNTIFFLNAGQIPHPGPGCAAGHPHYLGRAESPARSPDADRRLRFFPHGHRPFRGL